MPLYKLFTLYTLRLFLLSQICLTTNSWCQTIETQNICRGHGDHGGYMMIHGNTAHFLSLKL